MRTSLAEALLASLAPGALGGFHLASLLFFLNPQLPFSAATVARGFLVYGAGLAAAGLLLQVPLLVREPGAVPRLLPWSVTLVLIGAAVLDAGHASFYAYYLPPGINDRLLKAALWLGLAALIFFYTALLHSLSGRAYGRRSRLGLALLALGTVYVVVERREAYRPEREPEPRISVSGEEARRRLLVVAVESATLDAVLPLAERGRLPFLADLLAAGAYGRLETLTPTRRGPSWTTLAAGKHPFKHGVVAERAYRFPALGTGELRLLPAGIGFERWGLPGARWRPIDESGRATLVLPEILDRLGVSPATVSWPGASGGPVHPAARGELAGRAGPPRPRLRSLPALERAQAVLAASLPGRTAAIDEAIRNDRAAIEDALALLVQEPGTGAVFVGLQGLAAASRCCFGGYLAVEFEGERWREAHEAAELLAAYYAWVDESIATLAAAVPEPRLVCVVSASGVRPATRRSIFGQRRSLAGALGDGPDGVLLLGGPGIEPNTLLTGARLVDVVPTVLYALGLPLARDFDGAVLPAAFTAELRERQPLAFIASYDGLRPR